MANGWFLVDGMYRSTLVLWSGLCLSVSVCTQTKLDVNREVYMPLFQLIPQGK